MNVVTDFAVYVASTKIGTHGIVMLIGLIHVAVVSVKVIVVTIVFRHEAIRGLSHLVQVRPMFGGLQSDVNTGFNAFCFLI